MRRGALLRCYLLVSHLFPLIAGRVLNRRLAKGKEHPTRCQEKLGEGLAPRPDGPLIWLNAVGLGEVMSLRGLIERISAARPDVSFLVTSTTRVSADVFERNLPPRTVHQFLPIDAPRYRRKFLDHFRPDLCIWAEQDLWPGFVSDLARRGVPQAVVAARMNAASWAKHHKAGGLYRDLFRAMDLVTAQDEKSAHHLAELGASAPIEVTGSLKPSAPVLQCDPAEVDQLRDALKGRFVWAVAPSHPEDEAIAMAAHQTLLQQMPDALLIIAPRYIDRADEIAGDCPLSLIRRNEGGVPERQHAVWLCDTFGDLGLIYRLSKAVLIGGTFSDIEGHNPWEAAALETAILHGPRTANFKSDFEDLGQADAVVAVEDATSVVAALTDPKLEQHVANAKAVIAQSSARTDALTTQILGLL